MVNEVPLDIAAIADVYWRVVGYASLFVVAVGCRIVGCVT